MKRLLVPFESFSSSLDLRTRMHRNLRKRNGLSEAFCNFLRVLLYPWCFRTRRRVMYFTVSQPYFTPEMYGEHLIAAGPQTPLRSNLRDSHGATAKTGSVPADDYRLEDIDTLSRDGLKRLFIKVIGSF